MGEEFDGAVRFEASSAPMPVEDAAFLQGVLEAIPASVIRLDPSWRISYINRLRGGLTLDEVIGQPARAFIAADDYDRWEGVINEALSEGEPRSIVVRGARAVGPRGPAHYEGHAVPIDHGDGRRGVCIVAFDISDRVARAEQQRRIDEQLQKAQKLDAVGSLTSGVAHNFNNMLAVILPALEHALAKAEAGDTSMFESALHAATRASELVKELTRFGGQQAALGRARVDLVPIVERAASMCRQTFGERVQIEGPPRADACEVVCDAVAVEQVVVNLLINARDASLAHGLQQARIGVTLDEITAADETSTSEAEQPYARIGVSDDGVGMSEEVMRRVFEPFFTTKAAQGGTGLGLATSYRIVRDHGGFIRVDSELGRGTTVEVYLPLREAR